MSALVGDLDAELTDALAPDGAPSDVDIANYLRAADIDAGHEQTAKPPFRVTDLASADWAGRKIRAAQARIDEAKDYRAKVLAQLDAHVEREEARDLPTIQYMESLLGDWLRDEIAADDSKKPKVSRDLPCGVKVKRTGGTASLEVDDADALVDWLKDHRPGLVTSETVWNWSKNDVKKLADDTDRIAVLDEESGELSEVTGARIVRKPYEYRTVTS